MNKLFFFPQVAEQTIYFPKFDEQSFFSQKNHSPPPPQESNGRPLRGSCTLTYIHTILEHCDV